MTRWISVLLLAIAAPAVAQEPPACAERAARAIGATVASSSERFALPGRPEIEGYTYRSESCVAFLAVSRPEQDLDLRVLTPSGLELERDTSARAWAYATHCGVAGQRVQVVVSSPTRGRFALVALEGAPPERPDLGRQLGRCFAGEPGRAAEPVGHRSVPESAEGLAAAAARVVERLGWPEPRVEHGRLRDGRASLTLGVEAGRCYLIVGRSTDPTVVVEGLVGPDRWRTPPHRRALLRECPSVDGLLEVFVGGAADAAFALAVADLPRPAWAPSSSVGAAALAPMAEEPRIVDRFHLRAGERLRASHAVSGECATLMAVPATGDLADLRLRVAGGPSDESADPAAAVHVCPGERVALEVRAERGAGAVWLVEWVR